MGYELRYYQKEAISAVYKEWNEGRKKTLISLATGTGKTIIFAHIAADKAGKRKRVLILAHRDELLDQAQTKLKNACNVDSALEKANQTSFGSPYLVIIASVQSMSGKRLEQFPSNYFDYIIIDEAHHSLSDTYQRVLNHFDAEVLGVTATPDRGDKRNLGEYFDTLCYEYSMRKAIKDGYLCPIKAQMIPLQLDISNVTITGGDYSESGVAAALDPYLGKIADEMANYCKGRKTVVFLPLIATSLKMCNLLNARGLRAREVNGKSKDRKEILEAFENGDFDVLCNSMLLTEGWDCTSVDCIVVLRPTKVRALYQQMIGRGTRPHPGKDHLLLLDFLWMTQRHNLCKPSSLMAENESIAQKIDEKILKGEEIDILEAEAEGKRDAEREREVCLAQELFAQRFKQKKTIDPMQYFFSIDSVFLEYEPMFRWECKEPTQNQINILKKNGFDTTMVTSRGLACKLIDTLITRSEEGFASPKQINLLERKGFEKVGGWSREAAHEMIDIISNNGWKVPYWINPKEYCVK